MQQCLSFRSGIRRRSVAGGVRRIRDHPRRPVLGVHVLGHGGGGEREVSGWIQSATCRCGEAVRGNRTVYKLKVRVRARDQREAEVFAWLQLSQERNRRGVGVLRGEPTGGFPRGIELSVTVPRGLAQMHGRDARRQRASFELDGDIEGHSAGGRHIVDRMKGGVRCGPAAAIFRWGASVDRCGVTRAEALFAFRARAASGGWRQREARSSFMRPTGRCFGDGGGNIRMDRARGRFSRGPGRD